MLLDEVSLPRQVGHSERVANRREEEKASKGSLKGKVQWHACSFGHTVKEGRQRQEEWKE